MNDNSLRLKGFLIWGTCALFFLYEFFLRTVIGTYQNSLMHDLNLTYFQFSLLSTTIFLLIYGLMQIPAGIVIDNIGLKKSLLLASLCCSLASFGFSFSGTYTMSLIYRMIMGFGASFGFICLLISVYDWMPKRYTAIFIGLSQFIGTLGPILAAGPLNSISNEVGIGWRSIFLYLGFLGVFLLLLILLLVENNKQYTAKYIVLYKSEKVSKSILRLFSKIQPWYIAIISTCLYFSSEYLSENEGRAFLELKNIPADQSAYIITTTWIGYAIGCPLLGLLSDTIERRKSVVTLCSVMSCLATLMIIYLKNPLYLQLSFFILGVSASGQSLGFAMMAEQFEKRFLAVGFGLNNAMITGFIAVSAPIIGNTLDNNIQNTSNLIEAYTSSLNILIGISAIALIFSIFFLKETFCKTAVSFTLLQYNNIRKASKN